MKAFRAICWWMLLDAASGWGISAHQMIANIAYKFMSEATRGRVDKVLQFHAYDDPFDRNPDTKLYGSTLAVVADWADLVRYTKKFHYTFLLHYIDIRDDMVEGGCPIDVDYLSTTSPCRFIYERDCRNDICVAGSINNFSRHVFENWSTVVNNSTNKEATRRVEEHHNGTMLSLLSAPPPPPPLRSNLRNNNTDDTSIPSTLSSEATPATVKEALMFITHFIADIHQPLHCARKTDKGGNSIHVEFNQSQKTHHHRPKHRGVWKLHAVWDTGIIERAIDDMYNSTREGMEAELFQVVQEAIDSGSVYKWLNCPDGRLKDCTSSWGEETFRAAMMWAYSNVDHSEITSTQNNVLGDDYFLSRLAIIKHQLVLAGIRLAFTLDLIFHTESIPLDSIFAEA